MPSPVLRSDVVLCCMAAEPLSAQEHAGQYSRAEIELGSRVYGTSCVLCHGPNGDAVTVIDA